MKAAPPSRTRRAVAVALGLPLVVTVGCSKDTGSDAAFCAALRSAPTVESVVSGYTGLDGPELSRRLDRAANAYASVGRTAPPSLSDDVDLLVGSVNAVIEAVRAHPNEPNTVLETVRATAGSKKRLGDATRRIDDYARKECGMDLNSGLSASTTTAG